MIEEDQCSGEAGVSVCTCFQELDTANVQVRYFSEVVRIETSFVLWISCRIIKLPKIISLLAFRLCMHLQIYSPRDQAQRRPRLPTFCRIPGPFSDLPRGHQSFAGRIHGRKLFPGWRFGLYKALRYGHRPLGWASYESCTEGSRYIIMRVNNLNVSRLHGSTGPSLTAVRASERSGMRVIAAATPSGGRRRGDGGRYGDVVHPNWPAFEV